MKTIIYSIDDLEKFKQKLLLFGNQFSHCSILDSNQYQNKFHTQFDLLAGFGCKEIISAASFSSISAIQKSNNWWMGYLSYDLKNDIEVLKSENYDGLDFPALLFFQPEIVIQINNYQAEITAQDPTEIWNNIQNLESQSTNSNPEIDIHPRYSKEKYIKQVIQLLNHIQLGDIFEVNFCQEYYAENAKINPVEVYQKLIKLSPTPFSNFLKVNDKYCLGASPERFLAKSKNKVISQPIKGTIKRGKTKEEDEHLIHQLKNNPKEQSENIMIVDLVRNDLSRIAKKGTVKVEELCGIYSFPQVHQMISTISCLVDESLTNEEILSNCFPMGSMTGAPKVEAMKLIERYESTKRGLYSGAVGYFSPTGDFDFNVVIRSLLYNASNNYLSFMVGSAITSKSSPTNEYDETVLKAKAIFEILS